MYVFHARLSSVDYKLSNRYIRTTMDVQPSRKEATASTDVAEAPRTSGDPNRAAIPPEIGVERQMDTSNSSQDGSTADVLSLKASNSPEAADPVDIIPGINSKADLAFYNSIANVDTKAMSDAERSYTDEVLETFTTLKL